MDPLGASSSIIAILSLIGTSIGYIKAVKESSPERGRLLVELISLRGILTSLKDDEDQNSDEQQGTLTLKSLRCPSGPLEQFETLLGQLNSRLEPKRGLRKVEIALKWPFRKEEIRDIFAALERYKSLFSLALQNDHLGLSKAIQTDIGRLQTKVDHISDRQGNTAHREMIKRLSALDFPNQQRDILARRQKDTGLDIFESESFHTWLDEPGRLLSCFGIPGAGKTMAASIVIDYLQNLFQDDVAIMYAFCDCKDSATQEITNLLRGWLKQLLQTKSGMLPDTEKLLQLHLEKETYPSRSEATQILKAEASIFTRIFIIVDALDEFESENNRLNDLVSVIRDLNDSSLANVMVTSRAILHIERAFQGDLQLEIKASSEDIRTYLGGQMSRLTKNVQRNQDLQLRILSEVSQAADGMFLLAKLLFESLTDKMTPKAVAQALDAFPRGPKSLSMAYDNAMDRIKGQQEGRWQTGMNVLSWVVHAVRPLKVRELEHALSIERGQLNLDQDSIPDIEDLVSCCAGLLIVDQESHVVRVVHYTAQEYLEERSEQYFPTADEQITVSCLTYLRWRAPQWLHFLSYAAQYWGEHARKAQLETASQVFDFLQNHGSLECARQSIIFKPIFLYNRVGFTRHWTALHLCAYFGLCLVAQHLIDEGHDPNYGFEFSPSPLNVAANRGHVAFINLLLDHGADINPRKLYNSLPLDEAIVFAAHNGRGGIVKLLLDRGADKDQRSWFMPSVVRMYERDKLCQTLINAGVERAVATALAGCARD